MKIGLAITTYNRPEYLSQCLDSLERADLSRVSVIIIQDDCSDDLKTKELIWKSITRLRCSVGVNATRSGIKKSLQNAFDYLCDAGCDTLINLDADAEVKPNFISGLLEIYKPGRVATAFHSTTFNDDGSFRHRVLAEEHNCYIKESVGGINMCMSFGLYKNYLHMFLNIPAGNWDHGFCLHMLGIGVQVVCVKKSLIDHIGTKSAMGHTGRPDLACGYNPIKLNDVTLFGVDAAAAMELCQANIEFANVIGLGKMGSKKEYNRYILKNLNNHFETSHVLLVQNDGYIVNWEAWDDSWLQYDYIGAPWHWYKDEHKVGNGGFSLRSKKLCYHLQNDPYITPVNDINILNYEEDHNICRLNRGYLEKQYGIKFAPIEVADKFSIEAFSVARKEKSYRGQFGFHGKGIIWK